MSRTYSSIMNDQKQPKVSHQAYIGHYNEPQVRMLASMPAELEAELLENSGSMRHEFRRLAQTLRNS